jgi:hypothetical protein
MIEEVVRRNVRYVRFETNQGTGYGCFLIDWAREDGELLFTIGASFCSPKDSFSKSRARQIAEGRSITNYQCGGVESNNTGYITDADFNNILNDLFYRDPDFTVIPNWARRAFNKGKYHLSLRTRNDYMYVDMQQTPTEADMEEWKRLFDLAKNDPDFSITINGTPVKIPK